MLTLQSSVTLMAVVRKRRLTYDNVIIFLMYTKYCFLNNTSSNKKTCLLSYGCSQSFAAMSFVVAMLDDILLLLPRFCAHICMYFSYTAFCYLNEDILIFKNCIIIIRG